MFMYLTNTKFRRYPLSRSHISRPTRRQTERTHTPTDA